MFSTTSQPGTPASRLANVFWRSEVIGAIPAFLASAESLYTKATRAPQLTDWSITREAHSTAPRVVRWGLDILARDQVNTGLHVTRVLANGVLLAAPRHWVKRRGLASLASGFASAAVSPRERYGSDGADQATAVVQLSNALGRLATFPGGRNAAVWNVSLQSTLSYAAAGYIKLAGTPWRDGSAVTSILRTRAYGHEGMWRILAARPTLGRALTYAVLLFECTFPAIYFLPPWAARNMARGGLIFHIVNGYAMGLWRFIFAFASMHPQLLITSARRGKQVPSVVPLSFLGATLFALSASAAASVMRRRRIMSGSRLTVDSGNELTYTYSHGDSSKPLVVFENGLLGLPEHYAWIKRFLTDEGYATITYSRAGYGGSLLRKRQVSRYRIDDSVDDLQSLVRNLQGSYPSVVLVGHSIGGEIVRRLSQRPSSTGVIRGVVYLDPTHPQQLKLSEAQQATVKDFTDNLQSFHWSTLLSLGTFLTRPAWIRTMPSNAQGSAVDQFRDHRLWGTGYREWRSMKAELKGGRAIEENTGVSALLISAGRTLSGDPNLDALHAEIVAAHDAATQSNRVVVADVTHDSMLTSASHAKKVAYEILAFLASIDS